MAMIRILDKLAVTLFYLSDAALILSLLFNFLTNMNISEKYIISFLYTICITLIYLVLRSISIKFEEVKDDGDR